MAKGAKKGEQLEQPIFIFKKLLYIYKRKQSI